MLTCEPNIDYLTGLTGSGPAQLASALLSHAFARGLPPRSARRGVAAVVAGASQLVTEDGEAPGPIVRRFVNYRGTTVTGLQAMTDRGFRDAVHAGLSAAEARALDMAQSYRTEAGLEFVNGAVTLTIDTEHREKRENI